MSKFIENDLEQAVLEWFHDLGYQIQYGPDISPGGSFSERESFGDVVLYDRLHSALKRINKQYSNDTISELVKKITRQQSLSIVRNNVAFQKLLTDGIDVEVKQNDGSIKTEKAYIFDAKDIENNEFLAINQYTVIENGKERRPDIVAFLNGIPVVVIELKNATNEEVDIVDGFNQLQTYKRDIPSLFYYNAFMITSDGINAKVGTITSDLDRFMFWRTIDGEKESGLSFPQLQVMLYGMMNKKRFLDMFVAMSRKIAVKLYSKIIEYHPEWHSDDIDKGTIKVIMTSAASDPPEFQPHSTTASQKKLLAKRIKDVEDELKIVIVCDMWLTGFDVPCLHTMYVDKPMSGHNLMQAIARVNRVFKDKPGGLIVDYIGIADNLRSALAQYTPSDRKTTGIDPQVAIDLMLEKYEQIQGILHGLDYSSYISGSASERMACIVSGVDFVLGKPEDEKKEFLNLVVEIGKAYALCSTSEQAQAINVEISYFKALKSGIIKILPKDKQKKTKDQIEYEIGQLVSKSVISEEVVDIFASVGLNKPDISILSDEFLEEVKGLPQKNLALELLRRLLDGKIKAIAKKNVVQAKKFSEMLEASVIQYEKRSLETVEVIKALVDMAKDMNELHKRGEKLGLSDDELAFYDAISSNESARDFYENDVLKQIAKELTISIKNNIKVDWDVRESVRAQMRITVKRLLRKYKYPPDKQATAVDLIIEQAEKMCENEIY